MSTLPRNNARAAAALALLLGGCAVGPDFAVPDSPRPDRYSPPGDPAATVTAGDVRQSFGRGGRLEAQWWRRFRSPDLDALMAEALAGNPGIEAARANLEQARHSLQAGYGVFYPSLEADAGATRQQSSPARLGLEGAPGVFNLFALSGTVTYALDPWGGNRRLVEELGAERDLAEAEEEAAFLTLESNLVETVIARAAYRAEIEATQALVEEERDQVRLTEVQAGAGTAGYAAVLALKSQLAATEATLPVLAQKAAQADDLLATLAGRAPGDWQAPQIDLAALTLPADLPVSLPSDLVRQRPDIKVAEAAAHAASANIGVATAAMLPNITLSASYGSTANRGGSLFTGASNVWSFGGDVAAPLFEGGALWYRRKAAIDAYQQAGALYRQTVLGAFAQVADSLQALDHDADALRAEEAALDSAQQQDRLVQANYAAGLSGYLSVLVSDGQVHQARIGVVQATALRYQDTVSLFAALGGGWQAAKAEAVAARREP